MNLINTDEKRNLSSLFILYVVIVFSNWSVLLRFTGFTGLSFYALFIIGIFTVLYNYKTDIIALNHRLLNLIPSAIFLALVIVFLLGNPIANNKEYFTGSDADDALNQAAGALLTGEYPYQNLTYLGNAISPLPGAVLIAVPFVWIFHNSGVQNLFWIAIYLILVYYYCNRVMTAVILAGGLLLMMPLVSYQIAVGSDHLSNSIYVLLGFYLADKIIEGNYKIRVIALVLFFTGICLSSRLNFVLLLPLFGMYLARKYEIRRALYITIAVTAAFCSVTLPFYFYQPDEFAPLHTSYKLNRFNDILPFSEIIVPLFSLVAGGLFLVIKRGGHSFDKFLQSAIIVLSFPVAAGVLLRSLQTGQTEPGYSSYSSFFLPFILLVFLTNFFNETAAKRN